MLKNLEENKNVNKKVEQKIDEVKLFVYNKTKKNDIII